MYENAVDPGGPFGSHGIGDGGADVTRAELFSSWARDQGFDIFHWNDCPIGTLTGRCNVLAREQPELFAKFIALHRLGMLEDVSS